MQAAAGLAVGVGLVFFAGRTVVWAMEGSSPDNEQEEEREEKGKEAKNSDQCVDCEHGISIPPIALPVSSCE